LNSVLDLQPVLPQLVLLLQALEPVLPQLLELQERRYLHIS
jgi:hypothetical protein